MSKYNLGVLCIYDDVGKLTKTIKYSCGKCAVKILKRYKIACVRERSISGTIIGKTRGFVLLREKGLVE